MDGEFAGIAGKFFEFQELQLGIERCIVHFKCPRDFLVWDKLVNDFVGVDFDVSLRVAGLEMVTDMLFVFHF
jgi:hypothetical protein